MGRLIASLLTHALFWAGLGVAIGPCFFFRGFWLLQRKRLIMDIPRSTVRAAALGPVEIWGKAVGPYPLVAPLSRADCLYYRIVPGSQAQQSRHDKMRELCAPLYLDDGTGRLMIYPQSAELLIPASCELVDPVAHSISGYSSDDAQVASEYCIKPGDEIFVLGTLRENPWTKKELRESSELSRIGPGFVSPGEADIMRHEALPLLDPSLPAGVAVASPEEFDFHPAVILMKGTGPFVISKDSQRELVAKLGWKSILYVWGGAAGTLWGLWEILNRAAAAGLL